MATEAWAACAETPFVDAFVPPNAAMLLTKAARDVPTHRYLGTREFIPSESGANERGLYEWYTYEQIYTMTALFARGLEELGIGRSDKVMIMSPNRTEWHVADVALNALGAVSVPIYDSQSPDEIVFVGNHSDAVAILVALERLPAVADLLARMPRVAHVVVFDDRWDDRVCLLENAAHLGAALPEHVRCLPLSNFEADALDRKSGVFAPLVSNPNTRVTHSAPREPPLGPHRYAYRPPAHVHATAEFPPDVFGKITGTFHTVCARGEAALAGAAPALPVDRTGPDDPWLLQYTSGTTGLPKGAILTNRNLLVGGCCYIRRVSPEYRDPHRRQAVIVSYLPNAHVFQHAVCCTMLFIGAAIGFFQGAVPKLMDDLAHLQPTILPSVPRVLQKLVDAVTRNLDELSPLKRYLFFSVYDSARRAKLKGVNAPFHTRKLAGVFFKAIRDTVGGRIVTIASGSAPLAPKTAEFITVTMDCWLIEGYGLSETASLGACQTWDDLSAGNVGHASPNMEFKLVSVPELDYLATDEPHPRGEICLRGAGVFAGYYKQPDKTAEVLLPGGWFRTGDVGALLPDGKLRIIDRVRNIFKLAQGEYISASEVEAAVNTSEYVTQCVLYASRYESYTMCAANFNAAALRAALDLPDATPGELAHNKDALALVLEDITRVCRLAELKSYEIPRVCVLDAEEWSAANGLATPSMKLKAPRIHARHQEAFLELYTRINQRGVRATPPAAAAEMLLAYYENGPTSDVSSSSWRSLGAAPRVSAR